MPLTPLIKSRLRTGLFAFAGALLVSLAVSRFVERSTRATMATEFDGLRAEIAHLKNELAYSREARLKGKRLLADCHDEHAHLLVRLVEWQQRARAAEERLAGGQ